MSERPHISNTQVDTYFTCGERYRRRYVEGEIIPPGIAALVGKGTHRGAEVNFTQKIDTHADLAATDIVEAAVAGFEAELNGGYVLSGEEESQGTANVIGAAKDQVASLAGVHAAEQAPDYQPLAVEHKILIPFPKATHDMLGYVDLEDDKGRVVDFKTAAKRKPESEVHNSTQLTIYAAAYQIAHSEPPVEVRLDTLVKTKKPGRQVLVSHRGQADFRVLINRINVMLAGVAAGIFPPAPVGSWTCSERWCGFWHSCPYVNNERRDAAERSE